MMLVSLCFCFLLIASPTLHGFRTVQAIQGPRGGSNPPSFRTSPSASWSSYVTVDPSSILSLLVQKAGFFLDPQLRSLADLLHCEKARLNVVDRELEVHNFTVSLPDQPHSSRIGRIHVTWDSYKQPCLEVEVEDVDVLVEFTNLIFTKSNWNELKDRGFPPEILYYTDSSNSSATASDTEFVRTGSIDLQGRVVLHTRSRPLQKPIAQDIVLNLQSIRELKYKVKALAESNERRLGRPGCTSEEVYDIFRSFFLGKIKQAVRYAVEDVAASQLDPSRDGSRLVNNSKQVLNTAKSTLMAYAANVELLSKDALKDKLKNINLQGEDEDNVLLRDEEADQLVSGTVEAVKGAVTSVSAKVWQSVLQLRNASSTNNNNEYEDNDEDDIIFPDW